MKQKLEKQTPMLSRSKASRRGVLEVFQVVLKVLCAFKKIEIDIYGTSPIKLSVTFQSLCSQ